MAEVNRQQVEYTTAVSVVIPVYNVAPYLRTCLDSVVQQTFSDMEILLVDDGSTDGSGAICDEYREMDSRIRVIHKENGGLGNARNVGMREAGGKYIIFLDSDDYWEPQTLEILYTEAEKNGTQLLLFSARPFRDGAVPDLNGFPVYKRACQNGVVKTGAESMQAARDNGEYYTSVCLCFYLFSYLKEQQLFFDEGIIHEDESFSFLAYTGAERVECLGERFYQRRFRSGSIITSKSPEKSAKGCAVALNRVAEAYLAKKDMPESLKTLYVEQMKMYLRLVQNLYGQALSQTDGQAAAETIEADSAPVRKTCAFLAPYLNRQETLSLQSLRRGYAASKRRELWQKCKGRVMRRLLQGYHVLRGTAGSIKRRFLRK